MSNLTPIPNAGARVLRASVVDTAWAAFILDPEGRTLDMGNEAAPSMSSAFNSTGKPPEVDADEPRKVDMDHSKSTVSKFGAIMNFLAERHGRVNAMKRGDMCMYIRENSDNVPTLHLACWVRNISEHEAGEAAEEAGVRYWVHSKAYHEGDKRIPTDMANVVFPIDKHPVSPVIAVEDENDASTAGKPFTFNASMLLNAKVLPELGPLFQKHGMFVVSSHCSAVVNAAVARYGEGEDINETVRKFITRLDSLVTGGYTQKEALSRMGLTPSDIAAHISFILPTKQE